MQPPRSLRLACRRLLFRHRGSERDHVVLYFAFNLMNAADLESHVRAQRLSCFFRNIA